MTRYDEMIGGKPGRSRHLAGSLPTTYHQASDKLSAASRLMLISLLLITMLTGGAVEVWGQTDYSGTYYIGSYGKNATSQCASSNPADNFYLCPTDGWCYFVAPNSVQADNNQQPFLTSYKCRDGVYDSTEAVMVITKHTSENYYYIQQKKTGRYLVFNNQLTGAGANRARVHFEPITPPAKPDDYALFAISTVTTSDDRNGYWVFHPKKASSGWYLNITEGNVNSVSTPSSDKKDGPTGYENVGGIVGQWNQTNNTSSYYLEVPKPVISQASDKTISISHPFGNEVNIYYTTDGTDPTTSSTLYTGDIAPTNNISQIKAIATNTNNTVKSAVATFNLVPCPLPSIRYDNVTKEITISSTLSGATVYYTIAADNPSDPDFSTETYSTEPITIPNITSKTVVKAFAAKLGYAPSNIKTQTIDKVATPVLDTSSGNSLVITCATEGATIYYTSDNSEPSTSWSIYRSPLKEGISGKIFRAFAAKANNMTSEVATLSEPLILTCSTPTIKRGSGNTFKISCDFPSEGLTIYYTTGSEDLVANPASGTAYTIGTEIPFAGSSVTVKAIAVADGYNNSELAERTITEALAGSGTQADPYLIESSGDFDQFVIRANNAGAGDYYKVTDDFTVGSTSAISQEFSGTFDGNFHTITGLTHSLFDIVNCGIVKNVRLSGVVIPSGTNVGAICNEANGTTKVYNCGILSGSVSGSNNVGGLVGLIKSGSSVRVVNCYNYADVSSSGDYAAGIVGKNEGTVASNKTVGNVRIAFCMMYGSVSGATHISPVYGGNHESNVQNFTEYNYYLYSNDRDANGNRIVKVPYTKGDYNDQLAIDKDDYLTRYPFYLHCMNTHRRMIAFFLFGENSSNDAGTISNANINEVGHWVIDKQKANYPIIEEWKSNTRKVLDAPAGTTVSDDNLGTSLAVTVIIGSSTYYANLPITDMDVTNNDYTWGKVVLPFANEFEVNNDYTKVCTGWKITNVPGGNGGDYSNYNVSDRDCTSKDLFSTTGFIYAQGGNYIVPYNVSSITIEANFATAFYLSDATYDVGYDANYNGATGLGGSVPNDYHGRTVYNSLTTAIAAMGSSSTPHTQAVVLVGNYHYRLGNKELDSYLTRGLTIMSIDEDNNQEPDYGWYSCNVADRPNMPPVRFDFLPMIPVGMAAHVTGSKGYPGIPIWKSRGWFEMTETCLSIMNQFELDSGYFTGSDSDTKNYRCIINGGYFVQMIRSNNNVCSKVSYYQIGGNAYIKEFYPGNHSKKTFTNPLVPINVTGGEIEECFMTGYKSGGKVSGENIYFWCAGGKIHKFLGAYMETPTATTVNMTAKIDHALIGRFFGGGTSPSASINGAINVTINNSKVDFYCGGPEFSNASVTPTVRTSATNTVFGEYYGAGFGGTAITYYNDIDNGNVNFDGVTTTYPDYFTTYYLNTTNGRLKFRTNYGIGSCYKFEYLYHSANQQGVARFFTGYAQFSLATTGNVVNELTNCKIRKLTASETVLGKEATIGDFYGAGCQGMVSGTVRSTLTNCEVDGSAYGGGYKATSNDVDVYPTTPPTNSVFTKETALFSEFGTVTPNVFTWEQGTASNQNTAVDCGSDGKGGKLYTSKDIQMSELGNVTGAIGITIDGGSVTHDVFGGGNESKSLNNATVTLSGNLSVGGNVYGGGNKANVSGNATVNIQE